MAHRNHRPERPQRPVWLRKRPRSNRPAGVQQPVQQLAARGQRPIPARERRSDGCGTDANERIVRTVDIPHHIQSGQPRHNDMVHKTVCAHGRVAGTQQEERRRRGIQPQVHTRRPYERSRTQHCPGRKRNQRIRPACWAHDYYGADSDSHTGRLRGIQQPVFAH